MCLYPKLIRNPKYKPNKKNGGIIPPILDTRCLVVPIGCQQCMECKKQKAMNWKVRLLEDIKVNKNGRFVTLTYKPKKLKELAAEFPGLTGYELDNAIATRSVRLFLENWRKKYGKSLRHWFVTELGHKGTEHLHIHGIVWTDQPAKAIIAKWPYGYVWAGYGEQYNNYVNEATVNYITKYVHKMDETHKNYQPIVLTSAGIGSAYVETQNAKKNKYQEGATNEAYRTREGYKLGLPIYYRNKLYTDEQRERLWIEKLNKQERYVNGIKVDISKGEWEYFEAVKEARKLNKKLGYGDGQKDWNQMEYERQRRMLKIEEKINNNNK